MRKALISLTAVGLLVGAMAGPVAAESWSNKITGGGEAIAGSTVFTITTSASDTGGQIQYSRSNLSFHASVECVEVYDGYAVASGPAFAQEGTLGGPYARIAVKEGGVGAGDQVRVVFKSSADCGPESSFPGTLTDGNFTIRQK